MKNFYPNEKFSKAIDGMATSPASLQERIRDAYIDNIMYVKDKDVSEDIRFDLNQLHATLTAVPQRKEMREPWKRRPDSWRITMQWKSPVRSSTLRVEFVPISRIN